MRLSYLGVIAVLEVLAATTHATAAHTEAGTNEAASTTLCKVYNALTGTTESTDNSQKMRELVADIVALNFSAASAEFQKQVKDDKAYAELGDGEKPSKEPELSTWAKYYAVWRKAKQTLTKRRGTGESINLQGAPKSTKTKLRFYAEKAAAALADSRLSEPAKQANLVRTAANKAIYGEDKTPLPNLAEAVSNLVNEYGTANGAKGSRSGQTIREDFLCLCAMSGQTTVDKVCCNKCTNPTGVTHWTTGAEGSKIFTVLADQCKMFSTEEATTADKLEAALTAFYSRINERKGSGQEIKFSLGEIEGAGSTGCDGSSGANGGYCVIYKDTTDGGNGKANIKWMVEAVNAVKALKQLATANRAAEQLHAEITALNYTAHSLADESASTASAILDSGSNTKVDCTKLKTNTTCTEKGCKWDSTTADRGEHCKHKDGEEQKTQGTDRSAGTNAEGKKCTDKKRKEDCKDCCKCEGK
uniref:Variant surface glycoprotein 1125.1132 n=1 Tax=Trypanosoma brucei TaxID=5691 RepID=M4SVL2_9TRYP|nr:variant surface glycoprotein 1135 [Trypanosoma brucei]APD73390.1 variant surface glycoprotein 1125.1132 [Trypanosoma brucei]